MLYDVIVIGAGPAGCAAAITAARAGATVLLLERSRFPRHKVCGEFVSAEALVLLQDLLAEVDRTLIAQAPRISEARIFADDAVVLAEIDPSAASITRFNLDFALWNACLQAGVDARMSCPVQSVEGHVPFRVIAAGEIFEGKALINAAGRWSFLTGTGMRRQATRDRWVGVKGHFRECMPSHSVDLYFFNGGYCGVQPVNSKNGTGNVVNACAMVRAEIATDLDEVLKCHLALELRSRTWQATMDSVSTSPLVFHAPEPIQGGILQVGDAATFVDPFIGDGISLGLRSGSLAAECLMRFFGGECSLERAALGYASEYAQQLAPVFWASSRLRSFFRFPAFIRRPVMSMLQRTPAITRQIVKMTR